MAVKRIATFGGANPSVYGFPIERSQKMVETDAILLTDETGAKHYPDFSVASWHHGPEEFVGGVTLYLPPGPASTFEVFVVGGDDLELSALPSWGAPRKRWLEDLVGARVVDHDHGPLRWHCERIGSETEENAPTFHGHSMTRWEAQGWLRNANGEPIVEGWLTLTTWAHTDAVHIEFAIRNQAPRGKKWGSRLIDRIAFEAFPGWNFVFKSIWVAGYESDVPLEDTHDKIDVFTANGDESFIMAEGDGIIVEWVATKDMKRGDAFEQPFAVLDAWDTVGWGYVDGMVPPPVAWQGAPMPARLSSLYSDQWWCARANDTQSAGPDDWYSIPRISVRAEDAWHHRAGAPHRNDLWDVPFLCRPSRDASGYVDDLHHYAKSFCEMPHQTTILDPETGELVRWEWKWGETKDRYESGRPNVRRQANDPDEKSFEASPRRWMLWENPGSNMTLDREHSDLACLEQAWLVSGRPRFRRFIVSRHYMTGLLPDGAGAEVASSDRMLAWYLQHHEVAARLSTDPEERKRRVEVGVNCLTMNARFAGQIRQGDALMPAPTVNGKVPRVMFLTGTWSGWAGWMVALQWQCGVLPIARAGILWGALERSEIQSILALTQETAEFMAARNAYYDEAGQLVGYLYKLHPHGEETIAPRVGAVAWGEGKGAHTSGYIGEAYHPTEPRVALNGSMSWYVEFWAALARFVPRPWLPDAVWKFADRMIGPHLEALRGSTSPFHPYRASAWNYLHKREAILLEGNRAVGEALMAAEVPGPDHVEGEVA